MWWPKLLQCPRYNGHSKVETEDKRKAVRCLEENLITRLFVGATNKQCTQCSYNVTLRRVRITIVTVEKQ